METTRTIILTLHIAAGFVALTIGLIPFLVKKGGKLHNTTGKIFYYAMISVALSTFALALHHFNPFLLMVGLLTLYSTITGYRGLQFMRTRITKGETRDWALLVFCGIGLGLTIWQTLAQSGTENMSIPVLVAFFGALLLDLLWQDVKIHIGSKSLKEKAWIRYHISRISGAYIATVTAFLVVNVRTDPAFIAWLLPTLAGVPVITYFQRRYREKTNSALT